MSAEGKFEKTRIQDPDVAHEEANMLRVDQESRMEGREMPSAQDYDEALQYLEELKKEAENESLLVNRVIDPMRSTLAGSIAVGSRALEILGLAIVNIGNTFVPTPKIWKERNRQELIDAVNGIGKSYEMHRANLASAQEKLETWKAEAEEFAKRQTG